MTIVFRLEIVIFTYVCTYNGDIQYSRTYDKEHSELMTPGPVNKHFH